MYEQTSDGDVDRRTEGEKMWFDPREEVGKVCSVCREGREGAPERKSAIVRRFEGKAYIPIIP